MCYSRYMVLVDVVEDLEGHCFFFFKQKTAYEMRISDWSSDVCSSDLEETETEFGADFLHLLQMPAGLGAGLVEVFERRAGEFELARGLEADGAVAARQRDVPPVFWDALDHRFPAEAGERHQQVVDAAGFVIGRRAVVGGAIDEFLVLGADAPAVPGLFARNHGRRELVAGFDDGIVAVGGGARAHIAQLDYRSESTRLNSVTNAHLVCR